jgi:lysophospholipase L1-like esterase
MRSLVVIGDSVGFGIGDEDHEHPDKGVGAFLLRSLPAVSNYANHSRPGARMREVFEVQLPKALNHNPDLVVVIAGGNDVLRQSFDPTDIYWSLYGTVTSLQSRGTEVLTMLLHDPNQKIRLPKRLARLLEQRVDTLNHIIKDVSQLLGAKCLDVRSLGDVYDGSLWHVDRMHPNRRGYHMLARHFAELLANSGHDVRDVTAPIMRTRSRRENIHWMLRRGVPWFLKRCKDLFPGVGYLLALETAKDLARIARKRRARFQVGASENAVAKLHGSSPDGGSIESHLAELRYRDIAA